MGWRGVHVVRRLDHCDDPWLEREAMRRLVFELINQNHSRF